MIEAARTWILSIAAVAMLVTLAEELMPRGTIRKVAEFTGGLVLLVVLLRPVLDVQLPETDFSRLTAEITRRQAELTEEGDALLETGIAERTASYISDKGARLGVSVTARVEVRPGQSGVLVPWSAELTGQRSEALSAWLAEELDIPAERQVWHENEG